MSLSAQDRLTLIRLVKTKEKTVTEACREVGISRKTFYKWLKRYDKTPKDRKLDALEDRKWKLKLHGRKIPSIVEKFVLDEVAKNPRLRLEDISEIVKQRAGKAISKHGISNILQRHKLKSLIEREIYKRSKQKGISEKDRYLMFESTLKEKRPVTEVCKEFNISRKTYYKWLKRYQSIKSLTPEVFKDKEWRIRKHPRSISREIEDKIISLVVKKPELSSHQIAQLAGVGNHGVQNVLFRNNLNLYEKRLAFAEVRTPLESTPVVSTLFDRVRYVWEQFVTGLAPAPPSGPVALWAGGLTLIWRFIKSFTLASLASFAVIYSTLWWIKYISTKAPSIALGTFFATIALTSGMLFFAYSLKYYISLAIVLSFSQQETVAGYKVQSRRKGLLSWILGLTRNGSDFSPDQRLSKPASAPVGLTPDLEHITLKRYPKVSVHLPLYNEKKVVERILNAVSNFDYKGEYEVIIADDSTDETTLIVKRYQGSFGKLRTSLGDDYSLTECEIRPGVVLKHLHRTSRSGFKGGALREALRVTDPEAEFISVFDADFVPYPDTLELFLKYFQVTAGTLDFARVHPNKNPDINNPNSSEFIRIHSDKFHLDTYSNIAAVQGYQWHVLNKSENWITRGVRSEYAGSYVIERSGAEIYSGIKQISGSVYMIRRDVLDEIGWETSITEDFQLTLKLYEKGYKVVYTPYIQAPAECVSTLKRLIRQRMRWAEGHSNNIKRMFTRLLFGHYKLKTQMSNVKTITQNSKIWIKSPLSLSEKFEFLYLSPYYLQSFFFLIGTFSWLISETLFPARLPFWTSLWGWSLVLTNFLSLPLMNAVGLFLEESEEKDYSGLLSFVTLSYLLVPFQAYAAIKGFLERAEGPWFRTPKTGRITDIFRRGTFYRFISGILPGRSPAPAQVVIQETQPSFLNKYLALATANSRFDSFKIKPKGYRFIGNLVLIFALVSSLGLSYLGAHIKKGSLADLPIQTRVEKTGEDSSFLTTLFGVFSPKDVMAATDKIQEVVVSGVKQVPMETLVASSGLVLLLTSAFLIHLYKKKRIFFKKAVKLVFVFSLILTWLLTGWPVIWKNPRFPPKINTVYAGSQVYSTAQNGTSFTVPNGVTKITVKAWGAGGGGGAGAVSVGAGAAGGGGGFAQGTITVTPGEALTIVLGGGGNGGNGASTRTAGAGGGGNAVTAAGGGTGGNEGDVEGGPGGGGGGYAAVKRSTTFLIQAGGAGGAGGGGKLSVGTGGAGGAGGGASGVAGSNAAGGAVGGGAGTASAGGAYGGGGTGGTAGSANTGGNGGFQTGQANGGGGAGGAGRFGGGGGGVNNVEKGGGGGGGGSDLVTGTNTVETAGSGTTPGNNSDSNKTASCSSNATGGAGGAVGGNGSNGNAGCIILLWPAVNQSAYRFFNNNTANTTDVGAALAAQNTAASLTSDGQDFRLRLLIHISDTQLVSSGENFKLQIAVRSGTCDTGFVGETYSDLATAAGDIRYFDDTDTAKTDGADLTANASDPTHAADTIRNQDYEEANNFTNTVAAIATGEDGKWDFSIVDFSAADNTTYCLRVVESGGTVLTTYTVIPEFTTVPENPILLFGLYPLLVGFLKRFRKK